LPRLKVSSQMSSYQTSSESGKPPGDWPTILANKRRKELRFLRNYRVRNGGSIEAIVEALRYGGNPDLDGKTLGSVINFTFSEYQGCGQLAGRHFSTLRPVDATQAQIDEYLEVFHRPRKLEALRKRRAEKASRRKAAADLDCRHSAILEHLSDSYKTVAELMHALKHHRAFRAPDGKALIGNSLRRAILRCVKSDDLAQKIETDAEVEKHGKKRLLIRCRHDATL
jgi:hypothetical protein